MGLDNKGKISIDASFRLSQSIVLAEVFILDLIKVKITSRSMLRLVS